MPNLNDIRKRIKSAVTDSDPEVRYDPAAKPGISNLLDIMAACTGRSIDSLVGEYGSGGYGAFKEAVAEAVVEELAPIKSAYNSISNGDARQVLKESGWKANELVQPYQHHTNIPDTFVYCWSAALHPEEVRLATQPFFRGLARVSRDDSFAYITETGKVRFDPRVVKKLGFVDLRNIEDGRGQVARDTVNTGIGSSGPLVRTTPGDDDLGNKRYDAPAQREQAEVPYAQEHLYSETLPVEE